jgi:hypothetical protein
MNTSFGSEDQGMSEEAKHIHDHKLLSEVRDAIADAYWQIFQPEPDNTSKVNPVVERLMAYLSHAISVELNDFEGWEEDEATKKEFNSIFYYQLKTARPLSERMQKIKEQEKDLDDNIPF